MNNTIKKSLYLLCFITSISAHQEEPVLSVQQNSATTTSSYQGVLNALRTIPKRMDPEQFLEIGSAIAVQALTKPDSELRTEFVSTVIKTFLAKHHLDKTLYKKNIVPTWITQKIPIDCDITLGVKELIVCGYLLNQTNNSLKHSLAHAFIEHKLIYNYEKYAFFKGFVPIYPDQFISLVWKLGQVVTIEIFVKSKKQEIADNSRELNRKQEIEDNSRELNRKQEIEDNSRELNRKQEIEDNSRELNRLGNREEESITQLLTQLIAPSQKEQKEQKEQIVKKNIEELKQAITQLIAPLNKKHIVKDISEIFSYNVASSIAHTVACKTGIDRNKCELLFAQDCNPKTSMQYLTKHMITLALHHTFDRFFKPSVSPDYPLRYYILAERK